MFVGGGFQNSSVIFHYSITADVWTPCPRSPAIQHGLATIDGELVSIGGKVSGRATNMVYTLANGKWKAVIPPMPTPRYLPSTVSYNNDIILAAAGITSTASNGEALSTRIVEVYVKGQQWYATKTLPTPINTLSTCVVDNTCYMLGGVGESVDESRTTLHTSLTSIATSTLCEWKALPTKHPLSYSYLVELDGMLVSMGGSLDRVLRRGTRFICSYDFVADMWVECQGAQLPVPLYRPGLVKLPGNKVMIIGGQPEMQQFSNKVYIGRYEYHQCV